MPVFVAAVVSPDTSTDVADFCVNLPIKKAWLSGLYITRLRKKSLRNDKN